MISLSTYTLLPWVVITTGNGRRRGFIFSGLDILIGVEGGVGGVPSAFNNLGVECMSADGRTKLR